MDTNNNFSARREVLLHPEQWRVVHPLLPACKSEKVRPSTTRKRWSQENAHFGIQREMLLSLVGNEYFGMDGQLYSCRPGTLFVIDPRIPHDNYYPESADGLEHVWLHTAGEHVMVGWCRIENGKLIRAQEHLRLIPGIKLGVDISSFPPADIALVNEYELARIRLFAGLIAVHLAQNMAEVQDASEGQKTDNLQRDVISAICRHIDQTAGKNVTLDSLSHISGYSKFHFLRIFSAMIGCTIHEYVNRARRRRMSELTGQGAKNREVAEALGFSCIASFLRWRRELPEN